MRKNATKLAAAVLSLAMVMTSVSMPASAAKKKTTKINKSTATLYTNGSKSQKSTTLYVTVGGKKVKATFKSSNTKILTVAKKTGKVTAKKPGKATVTATYKKKNYKCTVTVKAYATSVKVSPTSVNLVKGKTKVIKATVSPSNASNKKVSFKSSNKAVATVSSTGKITAKKAGTAKITVTALGSKNDAKKAYVTVKVTNPAPAPTETPVVTETPAATETPVATVTPSAVATEGTITISSNISGVGIKVVSGTAVYAAGTAEETTFTTPKLANGTYEVVVSKEGYEDVVVPVVVNGDTNVKVELKTAALAVESVKAINAKQIEVKFNHVMDRATVENAENYKIDPLNTKDNFETLNNIDVITLQDDGKTAIITLSETMTNGYEYEVTVYKEIKSAAGKNLTDKSVTKIVSNDSTRPVTTEIKTLAPNLLQVTFSEPVQISNPEKNIEFVTVDSTGKELDDVLNNKVFGTYKMTKSSGGTSYVIELDANLKQGSNYNLYVGSGNGITDYAGLKLTAEKHTFTYEADKEVTTVKNFTLLDGKTAKVTFTKPIKVNSGIKVYYNVDGVQGNGIAEGEINESTDAQTIKVTFKKLIPSGVKYFFVDGVYDLAGNKVEIGKFNITIPEYKTAEVSSVKLTDKKTIEVEFNQDIDDDKSYFSGDLTHDNKVRANIVLKDKDGKNVDIADVQLGKDSKGGNDYSKRIIILYKDLGEGNNTLTINNLVDELGRSVTAYSGTVSYANSTEFSAKLKEGKTEGDDKTVAVLSIDESKAVPTQASVENLKNWTVNTTYGKKTLAEVAGAKVKMVSNDVYVVEADKGAFTVDSVVLSNLETAAGLTIPSTNVDKGDKVNDLGKLAETKGNMSFDGKTITIELKNMYIGSFSPSDFKLVAKKKVGEKTDEVTPNDYTVDYKNDTTKDAFSSKITIKLNNNVSLVGSVALTTADRTATKDIFGNKLEQGAALTVEDTSKAAIVSAYISNAKNDAAKIHIKFNDLKGATDTDFDAKDFTVVTTKTNKKLEIADTSGVTVSDNDLVITLKGLTGADADILENEEVTVSYNKKLSTSDVVESSMSATTKSLRMTKISFGSGASAEQLTGDETITFTFNKTLNPKVKDTISFGSTVSVSGTSESSSEQTITTDLGKFVIKGGKLFDGGEDGKTIPATYDISGDSVTLKLSLNESYEVALSDDWKNMSVTYDSTNASKLADIQALDETKAVVSGTAGDDAINSVSKLTTGDIISYKAVEDAITAFKNAVSKDFTLKGDIEAAAVAQKNATDAIKKTSATAQGYYNGTDDAPGDIVIESTKFTNKKNVFEVYEALTAEVLQSKLNKGESITKASDLGLGTDNKATITLACDATSDMTGFTKPSDKDKEYTVKATIESDVKAGSTDTDYSKTKTFSVTYKTTGDIVVNGVIN